MDSGLRFVYDSFFLPFLMEAPPGFEPGTYAGTKTLCVEPDFTKGLQLAPPAGLEPATPRLEISCSNSTELRGLIGGGLLHPPLADRTSQP